MTKVYMHRGVRAALGLAIGALALWLSFRGVDAKAVWRDLATIRLSSVLATLAAVAVTIAAIVIRWSQIVRASGHRVSLGPLASAVVIGQATNVLLPFRVGEIARAYSLSRSASLPFPFVLATIAVERIADMAGVLISVVVLSSMTLPEALPRMSARSLTVAGLAVAGVMAVLFAERRGVIARLRRAALSRFAAAAPALDGLRALQRRRTVLVVSATTAVIVFCAALTNYVLFAGAGLALPFSAALALLVLLQVGTSVASVPGNLGVFHYVTVLVLTAYGADRTAALTYAWALYLLTIVPRLVAAAACAGFSRWSAS